MTNAERQRAFRARLREKQPGSPPPPPPHETAALRARIAQLEADLAAAAAGRRPDPLPKTPEELLARAAHLREEQKARRAAAKALAAEKYADMDEKTLQERLESIERQLAAARTEIKNLKAKVRYLSQKSPPLMTKKLHRQVLSLLHPDRVPSSDPMHRKYERCFQDFSAVAFSFPP
jgi:DNA repair exonuclease SbcCD ATPase subunit